MAKKSVKKKGKKTTKKRSTRKKSIPKNASSMDKVMLENFVSLQKVLTNLAIKFDSLGDQISKLLHLFEISAKSFVEKETPSLGGKKKDKEFLEKLDKLLDQNKIIAKGLTLMEEKLRERLFGPEEEVEKVIASEPLTQPLEPQKETGRPRYPQPKQF